MLFFSDLPILSPDPEIANLYSSKSGAKRIFIAAKVEIPPSEFDIYSLPQVCNTTMALPSSHPGNIVYVVRAQPLDS